MKIWTNNSFKGFYPVGTAAVIVAESKKKAVNYLDKALKEIGLEKSCPDDMKELLIVEGNVQILHDGNY